MSVSTEANLQSWFPTPQAIHLRPFHTGYSIDPPNSPEVDDVIEVATDSIHCDNFMSFAHLANGSLLHQSPHVDLARKKGWSYYDHDTGVHDLLLDDRVLALLSLDKGAGNTMPALTVQYGFSKKAGIGDVSIFLSQVAVEAITYEQFDRRYAEGDIELIVIANAAKRLARYFHLEVPSPPRFSETVVASHMIAANAVVAKLMVQEGVPILRRLHTPEAYESWQNELEKITLKSLGVAMYGYMALRHLALGLKHYCHITSPLRRFADLVNHINIQAYIEGKEPPFNKKDLSEIANELITLYMQSSQTFAEEKARQIKILHKAA